MPESKPEGKKREDRREKIGREEIEERKYRCLSGVEGGGRYR
jgi:hypothetical protein